jgi:hypothetical protein
LELILGTRPPDPEPDSDPLLGIRQWLAERNLGLVPVADPPASTGQATGSPACEHAATTTPSSCSVRRPGRCTTRAARWRGTAQSSKAGCLSRLDVHLPIDAPYGDARSTGSVAAILIAPAAEAPLVPVESVNAIAGRGLEGDRYHDGRGTFSGPGRGYQLTLVAAEVLNELGLPWEDARRNIATRGIDLNALVGRRFTVGAVECIGRRLAEPCAHLERVSRPGLLRPLVHRAGLRADILSGGTISLDDHVAAVD